MADSATETATTAKTAVGTDGNSVPRYGWSHPEDGAQKVISVESDHITDLDYWVAVEWRTPDLSGAGPDEDDPLSARAEIHVGYAVSTEEFDKDLDGQIICNTLREPFEPGIQDEVHDRQVTITQYQSDYNASEADSFENHVNSDGFMGWPAGKVLCNGITADRIKEGERMYWRVSATFTFRLDGWLRRVANKSYHVRFKDEGGHPVKQFGSPSGWRWQTRKDSNGEPVSSPQFINAFGDPMDPADEPIWLYFRLKRTRSFAGLRLRI